MKKSFLGVVGFTFFGVIFITAAVMGTQWYITNTPLVDMTYPDKEVVRVVYIAPERGEEVTLEGEAAKQWFAKWEGGYSLTWVGPSTTR